jgi:hypothetical protein
MDCQLKIWKNRTLEHHSFTEKLWGETSYWTYVMGTLKHKSADDKKYEISSLRIGHEGYRL